MILQIAILTGGFFLLILGANWLVNGASAFARKFGLSEMMIGLTIVAFGTSTPELVVNLVASGAGQNEVVMGNVIGSNIFNLLLILGVTGLIFPVVVNSKTVWYEIPISIVAVIVVFVLANLPANEGSGQLSRWDGFILLFFFIFFLFYILKNMKTSENTSAGQKTGHWIISPLMIVFGLAGLVIGGRLVVQESSEIAANLGMSERLIGLTIISIGTSLPELATSVIAAIKKNSDMAIGNIIGSNIFNIFFILGVSAVTRPIKFDLVMNIDIYILGGATFMLFATMFSGGRKKLDRWESLFLTLSFIGYMVYIVIRN